MVLLRSAGYPGVELPIAYKFFHLATTLDGELLQRGSPGLRATVFHIPVRLRDTHTPQCHHGHLDMLQNLRRPTLGKLGTPHM